VATNKRTYYAVQRVGIAPLGSASYTSLRGVQTCGMTTTFNLVQAFEMGQLAIYENIEGIPDVEVSVEKVLDGYAPIYTLATQQGTSATLAGRSNARCSLALAIYSDTETVASGTPVANVELSGLYLSSLNYAIRQDSNATETVTMVGNNKVWKVGAVTFGDSPFANNDDAPTGSGVQRRQHVKMGAGGTKFPKEIPGIDVSGHNVADADGSLPAHIQSFTARTNLGRDQLFELGRRGPYHRFVRFPTEVTTEFGITASAGDGVSMTEEGIYGSSVNCGNPYNLSNQAIVLKFCEGLVLDLGSKNKLASVGVTGGDAGGGNVEVTYTYTNFNDFAVYHPADPNAGNSAFQYT